VRGFVAGDAKVPFVACADIGVLASVAFARRSELIGKNIPAVGDLVTGHEIAETLGRLRGERFRYVAAPGVLMWLFAREFYTMRRAFEKLGRPPVPKLYGEAIGETRRLCPEVTTMEKFLRQAGYETKTLA
jgi:hypothetical protein